MANIMLTDSCNLHCPYCFANEFVNHSANEISMENLKKAMDFIASGNETRLGLIGGEPTLHSQFREILQLIIADTRFNHVMLYTNGVKIDEFVKELSHPKFHILLNCNNPSDMGKAEYERMCDNLELFINQYYMKERITLGINIYQDNFEYQYLLNLLRKYNYDHVRMSIVVPNTSDKRKLDVKGYFRSVKPKFKDFVYTMLSNDILPHYDCNKMPACLLTSDEIGAFTQLMEQKQKERARKKLPPINLPHTDAAIYTEEVHCSPVIDIRQDLTAVRCFGLSDCTKVKITDFKNINDLRNYYLNEIDSYAFKLGISHGCMNCYRRKTLKCTGGCLAFKIKDIIEMREQNELYARMGKDEK